MRNLKIIKQIVIPLSIFCVVFSLPSLAFAFAQRQKVISAELRKPKALSESEKLSAPAIEYEITEDDQLDITVWKYVQQEEVDAKSGKKEYLINKGDTLEISVWQWPDMLKDVIVRPDGKISYPLTGDIDVEGITLTKLRDILNEKLKDYIREPQISVMVKQFGISTVYGAGYTGKIIDLPYVKIDDLSSLEIVRPDGKISFPLLGDLEVRGLTVDQAAQKINKSISSYVKDAYTTVSIEKFGGRKIIILGEVTQPGVYSVTGKITLLETIALAQGYTNDAILRSVLVIRGKMDKPEAKIVNLLPVIKKGDLSNNIAIFGGDIVYVPKSHISNINYILNQIIGPLATSASAVPEIKTIRMGTSVKK
ncbi:MAG: polysaccharide biosynthesis/export family protein [Candidatus Omnitrophota bacterium]|nr:polysaccharide biosynthesis/export family protein [Candidatus Omnitrophota bacterium]